MVDGIETKDEWRNVTESLLEILWMPIEYTDGLWKMMFVLYKSLYVEDSV